MPVSSLADIKVTVANAVWIATALLQRKNREAVFSTEEIVKMVKAEKLSDSKEHVIAQHVRQHCVANRLPQPNTVCMLTALGRGDRRLFREGDKVEAGRNPERTHPDPKDIPPQYHELIRWYEKEWFPRNPKIQDPLLAAAGTGRTVWKIDAVLYVQQLREEHQAGNL